MAQYLALRLNVLSGRKQLTNNYTITAGEISYLGLTSPTTLGTIFSKIEGKLSDNGSTSTRNQFLTIQGLCGRINNIGN